jgi:hypothetical protein
MALVAALPATATGAAALWIAATAGVTLAAYYKVDQQYKSLTNATIGRMAWDAITCFHPESRARLSHFIRGTELSSPDAMKIRNVLQKESILKRLARSTVIMSLDGKAVRIAGEATEKLKVLLRSSDYPQLKRDVNDNRGKRPWWLVSNDLPGTLNPTNGWENAFRVEINNIIGNLEKIEISFPTKELCEEAKAERNKEFSRTITRQAEMIKRNGPLLLAVWCIQL